MIKPHIFEKNMCEQTVGFEKSGLVIKYKFLKKDIGKKCSILFINGGLDVTDKNQENNFSDLTDMKILSVKGISRDTRMLIRKGFERQYEV